MGEIFKPNCQANQAGVDRQGNPWVSFDYTAFDLPELIHNPAFHRFLRAMDLVAYGITLNMFVTVLARHTWAQVKAFEMSNRMSARQIGKELHIYHKTAIRWVEQVKASIREVSPLGIGNKPAAKEHDEKERPIEGHG